MCKRFTAAAISGSFISVVSLQWWHTSTSCWELLMLNGQKYVDVYFLSGWFSLFGLWREILMLQHGKIFWTTAFQATVCVCPVPVSTWQHPRAQHQVHKEKVFSSLMRRNQHYGMNWKLCVVAAVRIASCVVHIAEKDLFPIHTRNVFLFLSFTNNPRNDSGIRIWAIRSNEIWKVSKVSKSHVSSQYIPAGKPEKHSDVYFLLAPKRKSMKNTFA